MLEGLSVTSVGLIIVVCLLVHRSLSSRSAGNLSPSPGFCLPIIGHIYLLREDMRPTLARLRKQCGDVYYMQWGSVPVVIISGYDVIVDAFKKQADLFAARPKLFVLEKFSRGKGIAFTSGEPWREHRRFTLGTLKDFGMGKTRLDATIQEQAALMVEEIGKHNGEPFDPKHVISTQVANVICSMLFRRQFKHDDPRFRGLIQIFDENVRLLGSNALFFPWAARLPGDPLGIGRLIANIDAVREYCAGIIREHVETYDENCINDLVSAYVKEMKKHEKTKEQTTMSYEYLDTVISDMFAAGTETTTNALRWSIVCLTEYPEIQESLYGEITSSIGMFRPPSVLDRSSLVHVEAFFMEVLSYLLRADMRPTLARLRKQCGDVYYMQWGSVPIVIISGYDVIADAFKKQADLFAARPKLSVLEKVTRGKGIVLMSEEPWREHRRFALGTLKDFGMGKTRLDTTIQEQASLMVEEIGKHNGEPFDPKDVISTHVANVICSMLFRHDDPRLRGLIKMLDENVRIMGGITTFFPWVSRLPGDPLGIGRVKANSDALRDYCADIVREHVETYDENCIEDLVSAYIREVLQLRDHLLDAQSN